MVPSSGKSECILDKRGIVTCYVKNPPEKGKANKELIALLAKKMDISQHEVGIVSGLTSRKKRIKIERILEYKQFLAKLGLEEQKEVF